MVNTAAPMPSTECAGDAHLFDGRSSTRHDVHWQVQGRELVLHGPTVAPQRWPLAALHGGESWPNLPWPISGPDGATLWLRPHAQASLGPRLRGGARRSIAARLSASWPAALLCTALLIAVLAWFDRQGAALAAREVLHLVPERVDAAIGEQAMQLLETQWFEASKLDEERQWQLRKRFTDAALHDAPQLTFQLEFRRMKGEAGFNAFALPGGTIVLLDGMAERLSDDEVMVVLAHELGHVAHRHSLNGLVRSFGLLAVAGTVLADFSQVAATTVATLQGLRHQRDAEREADTYGARFSAAMGLAPEVTHSLWRKLQAEEHDAGADAVPRWLSTHPSTAERLREAARAPAPAESVRNPQ
jgi:Zn-dependent protease with chaperone function